MCNNFSLGNLSQRDACEIDNPQTVHYTIGNYIREIILKH